MEENNTVVKKRYVSWLLKDGSIKTALSGKAVATSDAVSMTDPYLAKDIGEAMQIGYQILKSVPYRD